MMKVKAFMTPHRELAQQILFFEEGKLDVDQTLDLFSVLIQNGMAWTLQGSYGRMARHLIDQKSLSEDGTITHEFLPF